MKIGINITPLITEHKDRGIGRYTKNLLEYLRQDNAIEVVEFTNPNKLNNIDLLHYPWFDLYFHTLPIFKKYPTVVTVHDVMPLVFPKFYPAGIKGNFNFTLQKIALKRSDFIITDSEASRKDINKFLKVDPQKMTTILLASGREFAGNSKEKELELKKKYNLGDNFLLYVGDCNYIKNIPFLIEGFNKLIQKNIFSNIKLVLAGEIFLKPQEELIHTELGSIKNVNELINRYSLKEKIVRVGNLRDEELEALYKLAFVYIQPSLYEGFGLPVLEAMTAGTPVVSSNAGSLPEVGGDAVVYFNPTNIEDFIFNLKKVMLDSNLRDRMIDKGLKRVSTFSWEKVAKQTIGIYEKVLSKNV